MPRRPNVPCIGCGTLCWPSKRTGDPNYVPPAEHRCQTCRRNAQVVHGTRDAYRQHGCRCSSCREWNRSAASAYRDRRRQAGDPVISRGSNSRWWITDTDRRAIYDRDGWICQLCNAPVDREADHSTAWYPSLDHIVPRSMGGTDESANLRTAHRWCNSVRGDGRVYDDAFFASAQ